MARPRHENPTPAELEVLQVIWERGESTVREMMTILNKQRPRAYTSVMSLMNVMFEKGLLTRKLEDRAYIYGAKVSPDKTQSRLLREFLNRTFDGSASALVAQLLEQSSPSDKELEEIRKTLTQYSQKGGSP